MKTLAQDIIELAVHAPSGHNSQPWRFTIKDKAISIWNVSDKDQILFNYKQRGSLIAIGALIENFCIIASKKGYQADVTLFPVVNQENQIANIQLIKSQRKYEYEYLFSEIKLRATNRKPYQKTPLEPSDRKALYNLTKSICNPGFNIFLKEDTKYIHKSASAFSIGDRLIFENFYIHKALFSNVNWTKKQEEVKREGLYIGTKELSFFEKRIFRYFLSNWSIIQRLKKLKISQKAAYKRQSLYKSSSAVGLIVGSDERPQSFVTSGRILQRLWLITTSLGLSFQPVSVGLLYLAQRVNQEHTSALTLEQRKLVKDAYNEILDIFQIMTLTPTFSFRIGYADPPTVTSLKKTPEIIFENFESR